jgi:hypothetical protein
MVSRNRKSVFAGYPRMGLVVGLSVVIGLAAAHAGNQDGGPVADHAEFAIPAAAAQPSYMIPGPPEVSTLYADGSPLVVETNENWRLMCGSNPAGVTTAELKTWADRHYAGIEAGPITVIGNPLRDISQINIVFNTDASVPAAAISALANVATYLEGMFSDPITVTINVSFQDMGSGGIIGGTSSSSVANVSYSTSRAALVNGMDSDDVIQNWLPTGNTIPVRYNGATDTISNETGVDWTRANYRAAVGSIGGTDASMTFNTQFPFDYDPSNGLGGSMSFVDVCIHETGHALGFVSGADGFGSFSFTALDLFRFQRTNGCCNYNPGTYADFQTTPRLVSYNSPDDDANSDLISVEYRMSDGTPYQASHFREQSSPWIGLMDPAFAYGETHYPNFFSAADKNMFDAMGYDYPPCVVPQFTQQLAPAAGCVGDTLHLSVAVNIPAPAYQWRTGTVNLVNDGVHILGATSPTLTIAHLTLGDINDQYNCLVTNTADGCTAASSNVLVYVHESVAFISQPNSQTLNESQTAVFAATATGEPPLSYQWRHNGVNLSDGGAIAGASTQTLIIWGVLMADTGNYDCVVTNSCGPVPSNAAHLVVNSGDGAGRGDLNCDGSRNFGDINPFVLALSAGESSYYAAWPDCQWYNADINADGIVGFGDINPFVALLSGP